MKLITYMMQLLTSILSPKKAKPEISEETQKIEMLEEKIRILESNQEELAFCIQQIAGTLTSIATHAAAGSKDPIDEILKFSGNDDDGSGYLH